MLIDTSFTLYLIRHGITEANQNGMLQGQRINLPLLPSGIRDAELTGLYLQSVKWTLCVASDLQRAWKTAELIKSQCTADFPPLQPLTILREVNYGVKEGYPTSYTIDEARRQYSIENNIPLDDVIDWAETEDEIALRQRIMLDTIVRKLHPEEGKKYEHPRQEASVGSNSNTATLHGTNGNMNNIKGGYSSNDHNYGHFDLSSPTTTTTTTTTTTISDSIEDKLESLIPNDMKKKLPKNVLVVTHGGFIRRFLANYCQVKGITKILNCSITKVHVRYNNGEYEFDIKSEHDINSIEHLLSASSLSKLN